MYRFLSATNPLFCQVCRYSPRSMRFVLSTLMLLFLVQPLSAGRFVGVEGRNIVTPDGVPLQLRGVNLGFWLMPEGYWWGLNDAYTPRQYYDLFADLIGPEGSRRFWYQFQDGFITRADILYIKSLGFNSVRVPFDYRLFADEYYLGSYEPRGFELLDRLAAWCREAGLWVVLDMHAAPGSQAGWHSDDGYTWPWLFEEQGQVCRNQTIEIWTRIAKHYRNDTVVIGYDLLNEPIHQYCDTSRLNARLEPFYKELIAAMRKFDKNHLVFLAGAYWSRNFDVFSAPFDDKLVYTTHLYNFEHDYTSFDYFVNFSKKHNVPVWLGEFGERQPSFVDSLRTLCEANGIGWCLWSYKKMSNNRCIAQIPTPEHWDSIAAYSEAHFTGYADRVAARPANLISTNACEQFLRNMLFDNCMKSDFYFSALGINAKD